MRICSTAKAAFICATISLLVGLSSTASSQKISTDNVDFQDTSERVLRDLYEKAKPEGEVVWGATAPGPSIAEAFNARFPGIKLRAFHAPAPVLVPRLLTEALSNRVSVDVGATSLARAEALLERDLLVSYDLSGTGVPPTDVILDGRLILMSDIVGGWLYNTRRVSPADVPRTMDDLLKPRWKGRIAVQPTGAGFRQWNEMPLDQLLGFLTKLGQQNLVIVQATQNLDRVARGESDLTNGVTFNTAILEKEKGAPIDVAPISPLWAITQGLFSIKGIQHPNAAKLFITWATGTKEGREALAQSDMVRYRPCGPHALERWLCDKKLDVYYLDTFERVKYDNDIDPKRIQALGLAK